MVYGEEDPVCWSLQPISGVPARQVPARVVGRCPGFVKIRFLDETMQEWVERPVREITLRPIGAAQLDVLRKQEAARPVARPFPTVRQPVSRARAAQSAPPALRSVVAQDPNWRKSSFRVVTSLRASDGRPGYPDMEVHIKTALLVLIGGETLDAVGRLAGVSREQVRQRVRRGIVAATHYLPEAICEQLSEKRLYRVRRYASWLKPALEAALASVPPVGRRAVSPGPHLGVSRRSRLGRPK